MKNRFVEKIQNMIARKLIEQHANHYMKQAKKIIRENAKLKEE